jgi:DNA-binding NarL/FixJ family response regulator
MAKTIGVVNKAQAWDELLAVVQRWWKGREDTHPELLPGCNQQLSAIYLLSPREQRVLRELGCGLLNKEIALRLDLSVSTVESYRKSMAGKLGVSGAELVRLATLHRALSWDAPSIEEA